MGGASSTPPGAVYEHDLPDGLRDQTVITVRGQVNPNAHRFSINLHKDNHIAFYFNPRFNEDGRQVIVRNSRIDNNWGLEERNLSFFPFKPGESFEVEILCTDSKFRVEVDKKELLSYKHRIKEINQIRKLTVNGDVLIRSVTVNYPSGQRGRSNSLDLDRPSMAAEGAAAKAAGAAAGAAVGGAVASPGGSSEEEPEGRDE